MRPTRLLEVFCVALCAAALALPAHAEPAGKVLAAGGDVLALRGSQILRLSSGAAIESGDQIHTGADGKALIVFTDSGLIWIRSNSDFVVDEYSYTNGQGGRESAFFSLLKGGARSVTGLIGRRNRMSYRLRGSVATIGIRGTDFSVVMCQRDCRDSDGGLAGTLTDLTAILTQGLVTGGQGTGVPSALVSVVNTVGGIVAPVVGGITTPVVSTVGGIIAPVTNTVGGIIAPVTNTVGGVIAPVTNTVGGITAPVTNTVGGITAPVVSTVTPVVAPVVSTVTPVIAPITAPVVSTVAPIATPIAAPAPPVTIPGTISTILPSGLPTSPLLKR